MVDAADHDLLIKIKLALESFIKEVELRLKTISEIQATLCEEVDGLKEDGSGFDKTLALVANDLGHLTDEVSNNKKDMDEKFENSRKTVVEWIAIASVISVIIGIVIGLFIPG